MQQTSTNSRISIKDEAQDITFSSCGPNLGYDGWHGNWAPPVSAGICAVEMGKPGMKLFLQVSLSDDTSTNKWRNLSGNSQTYQSSNRLSTPQTCWLMGVLLWWRAEGPRHICGGATRMMCGSKWSETWLQTTSWDITPAVSLWNTITPGPSHSQNFGWFLPLGSCHLCTAHQIHEI